MKTDAMPPIAAIALERFVAEQSPRLLAYPTAEADIVSQRLAWMKAQGVEKVYCHGPATIDGFKTLGLGYSGLVLLVQVGQQSQALKLRRTDAPTASFAGEAAAITIANALHIGPELFSYSPDGLLMEYLSGPKLIDWLHSPAVTLEPTWAIVRQLLCQAFRLDQAGLDHGDLRCVTEHVLIDVCGADSIRPVLIDFGKASQDRRAANVTTLAQGLFLSTTIARTISDRFPQSALNCQMEPRRGQLIRYLRDYKGNPSKKTHRVLLNFLEP